MGACVPNKYLHARCYEPRLGIFLSPDPIGVEGGLNEYGYGLGNPINWTDRSGMGVVVCVVNQPTNAGCGTDPNCVSPAPGMECWITNGEHNTTVDVTAPAPPVPEPLTPPGPNLGIPEVSPVPSGPSGGHGQGQSGGGRPGSGEDSAPVIPPAVAVQQAAVDQRIGLLQAQFEPLVYPLCTAGTLDIGFTFAPSGLGLRVGTQITGDGMHLYGGVVGRTPDVSVAITASPTKPSAGLFGSVSYTLSVGASPTYEYGYGGTPTEQSHTIKAGGAFGAPGTHIGGSVLLVSPRIYGDAWGCR